MAKRSSKRRRGRRRRTKSRRRSTRSRSTRRGSTRRTRRKGRKGRDVRPKDVVKTAGREVNVTVYPGRGGSGERTLNGLKGALLALPKHLR